MQKISRPAVPNGAQFKNQTHSTSKYYYLQKISSGNSTKRKFLQFAKCAIQLSSSDSTKMGKGCYLQLQHNIITILFTNQCYW